MAAGELLLPDRLQLRLAKTLMDGDLFGIRENRDDYITLKSGRKSPHYLDIRKGLSSFATRTAIATHMTTLTYRGEGKQGEQAKYVVGSPEAMTSYGASIADKLSRGLLQPRVALNKASGNKTPILGSYEPGETVNAYDDVVTDGETKISTISSLRDAGLVINGYYVVLDREEGGSAQVAEETGIQIAPALGVSSMVRLLRAHEQISQVQYDNVARYMEEFGDPHAQELMSTAL